jgi:hypothetical protein
MYSDIDCKVFDILYKQTQDVSAFDILQFTAEDLEEMNTKPPGVANINMDEYCELDFLNSFKKVIDDNEHEHANDIMDRFINYIDITYPKFPINPNNNSFSSVSGTMIIKSRIGEHIEKYYPTF